MSETAVWPAAKPGSAQPTVRRLIVYLLLAALVSIAAGGLSGLLGRLLGAGSELVSGDTAGLARSLAFALIGGPLAGVLWWLARRRIVDGTDRAAPAWGLYLAAMTTVSLVVFCTATLIMLSSLPAGNWRPQDLATGLVWAAVWVWHTSMWRRDATRPTRLQPVPPVLGAAFGLILTVGGTVTALGLLLDRAIRGAELAASAPWWRFALQAVVWAVGGALIWWWHWRRDGAARRDSRLGYVALVLIVLGGTLGSLGGIGTALFVVLRLLFDRSEPANELLVPLAPGLALAVVGTLVWTYHRRVARTRSPATRRAAELVASGVALAGAASGIGVIVNSLLAALGPVLVGADSRTLLLGGISSLLIGGPAWWLIWRPTVRGVSAGPGSAGRRIYLISVFGLSAFIAVITLLVIGYRVFEFTLGASVGAGLVDRVRAPIGLLVATALVAGYHYDVWRRDRADKAAQDGSLPPAPARTIGEVILVSGADQTAQARLIAESTGASVTVWARARDDATDAATPGVADAAADAVTDAARVARALTGVTGRRVLVVVGDGPTVQVIPLAD